jgi:predicted TIM-barrel fold metal-dependent hydrolase
MIVDFFTGIGNWPFRKLKYGQPDRLIELLDREDIDRAVVYSITSILAKDCMEGNREVAESYPERIIPFAVINPAFPGWEKDFRTCFEAMGFRGLRLFPTYHGYDLNDKCFAEIIVAAKEKNIPVALAVRVEDERQHHPLMKVPSLDLNAAVEAIGKYPEATFILSGAKYPELCDVKKSLLQCDNWYFDIGRMQGRHSSPGSVEVIVRAVEDFGAERMLYGSNAPFQYVKSSLLKVQNASISDEEREMIMSGNALGICKV